MSATMRETAKLPRRVRVTLNHRRRRLVPFALLAALGSGLAAQRIESTSWGFDCATVVAGFFNPLTVVVGNPSNAPIDTNLVLLESDGLRDLGAPLVERCYLAPGASRVVQFHPFVTSADRQWSLRWANAGFARIDVRPAPSAGWPVAVVMCEGDAPRGAQNRLPTFPAAWFPPIPGAAETLADVVLDFAPQWDEGRALAFLAWVRGGGRLHLALRDGKHPVFGGALGVLDDPRPAFAVGVGAVTRYAVPLVDLSPARLDRPPLPPDEQRPPLARAPDVLSDLQLSLLPKHAWGWIFTAALAFLVCVGPLHWRLARRRVDWRLSIGYLLGVVAAFTVLFGWLGARGYDEVSRVRTLAYARVCGDGELAVTQYTNAFVTTGGQREIRPRIPASLLSTAQIHEAVDGVVDNGAGGRLVVDMPMFSARGLVHRGHYAVADLPKVRAVDVEEFVVEGAKGRVEGGFLLRGGILTTLIPAGDRLVAGEPLTSAEQQRMARMMGDQEISVPSLAANIVRERLLVNTNDDKVFATRGTRVFVLLRSPPELLLDPAAGLGGEDGHVLLDYEVRRE